MVVAVVQAAMAAAEVGLYFLWSCCIVVAIVKKMETERTKAGIACDATARYSESKVYRRDFARAWSVLHIICMTDRVIRSEPVGKNANTSLVYGPPRVRRPHVGDQSISLVSDTKPLG